MSVIDNYFNIFREGADDAKYRQRALDTSRKLEAALKHIKASDLEFPKPGQQIVSLNLGEFLKDPELNDLDLFFVARDESENATRRGAFLNKVKSGGKRIELYVDVPDLVMNLAPEKWKNIVVTNASKILDRSKDIFWHEFVHYMDMKRMSPASQKASFKKTAALGGTKNPGAYFNDPVEFNAFTQQGLTRVEDHLSKLGSKAEVQKLIGKDANEFYKLVLKVLSPGMKQNLNDKFKNKLKKRVAQMWDHTMARFEGDKKNV
jgi:hypothetical protein